MITKLRISKLLVFVVAALAQVASAESYKILKVLVKKDKNIEIVFDKRVPIENTRVDYLPEIVQFSFKNSVVFPAKILPVEDSWTSKIFTYQYAPDLVRLRLSTKEAAIKYKSVLQTQWKGSTLVLSLQNANDVVVANEGQRSDRLTDKEREEILAKVSGNETAEVPLPVALAGGLKKTQAAEEVVEKYSSLRSTPEVAKSAESDLKQNLKQNSNRGPSLNRSLTIIFFFLAIMGLGAFVLAKAFRGSSSHKIQRFLRGITGGSGEAFIEILSRQSLGPKKSIVVARVKDRTLVLGMSETGISLITEFDEDLEEFKDKDVSGLKGSPIPSLIPKIERNVPDSAFSDVLKQSHVNTKNQIRSRLEGMKRL